MISIRVAVTALSLGLAPASAVGPAVAQADKAERVPVVVVERCAACHVATEFHDDDTGIDAPRFSDIRANPEVYTAERLRAYLADPHWPMSQFVLSPKDIDGIVAYLTGATSDQ